MQNPVSLPVAICIAVSATLRSAHHTTHQDDILEDYWAEIPGSVELSCKWGIVHCLVGDRERICRNRFTAIFVYHADPFGSVQIPSVVEEQDVTFYSAEAASPRKTCRRVNQMAKCQAGLTYSGSSNTIHCQTTNLRIYRQARSGIHPSCPSSAVLAKGSLSPPRGLREQSCCQIER